MGEDWFSWYFKKLYLIPLVEENKDIFNLKDLEVFAKKFALNLKKGSLVLLKGDLGSGKTTFIRFIINSLFEINKLNKPAQIKSPSFPILLTYDLNNYEIYHYDFYRIQNVSELKELDIFENFSNSISFIEWPEIILENFSNINYYLIEMKTVTDKTRKMNLNFFKN